MMGNGLIEWDGRTRCEWCGMDALYVDYHDEEWGRPVDDDRHLFEKVCLEGFQAGLSWLTVLKKRENFRKAFHQFDIRKVADFNSRSVDRLVQDSGIIRHRGKIESVINNARRALEMTDELGSLAAYFWKFEPPESSRPKQPGYGAPQIMTQSTESIRMSRDLKKRGWSFVGPITLYAFMQSVGIVNDHIQGCDVRAPVEKARQKFVRPA